MSYQGMGNYYSNVDTVDEVAEYTDMMGEASRLNHSVAGKGAWKSDPAKNLVGLWAFVFVVYILLGYFFRRYMA